MHSSPGGKNHRDARTRESPDPRVRLDDAAARGQSIFVARSSAEEAPCPAQRMAQSYSVLTFYTGGTATFEQRGLWSLQAGDALLVPAGEPHRHIAGKRPEWWGLGLCGSCLVADGAGALNLAFDRVRAGEPPAVRIPSARHDFLVSLFSELQHELVRPEGSSPSVGRSLIILVLSEVERAAAWMPHVDSTDSMVAMSLRFIEQNCLRPLTLREVGAAVHRSPAHLTTAIKRATGRSAVD